jgi:hypothetical protein
MMFVEEDFATKNNEGCRDDVCWKYATTKVVVVRGCYCHRFCYHKLYFRNVFNDIFLKCLVNEH